MKYKHKKFTAYYRKEKNNHNRSQNIFRGQSRYNLIIACISEVKM